MTIRRAALYVGGATLLVAWLSSAASLSPSQGATTDAAPRAEDGDVPAERLIADVQAQATRLRERLASAPLPQKPARNPFMFATAAPTGRTDSARRLEAAAVPSLPATPPEPALTLIGIAQERQGEGVRRTAMIATASEELVVAAIGDTVGGRYQVTAISQDAVELADPVTGLVRRLGLSYR